MRKILVIIALAFLAVLVTGCSKSSPTSSSGSGTLQINMVDSPGNFDAVNIVIDSVQAHIASSDTTSGWVTLSSTPGTYNLLELVNGANAVIGKASVPTGQYSQIRLFVGSGSNVVIAGASYPLSIPSGMQSGLKLNVDATIQSNITYVMTLDFNANQSIIAAGGIVNSQFILKPVIRVITTPSNGAIEGTVVPASARPSVMAFNSSDTVSTVADTSGHFVVGYLSSGSYSLELTPSDTTYNDTTITNVSVTDGKSTNVGTVTLSSK
ncbi:MAG: DUF4382 domain-containing protein [Bacteroidetes bacterium]|nr:DUF4382 domain-containing protein [Bacteroidota bacterium]MCL5267277.1 DUF4382 domain-containing protein [Bacteroidota bacterium]